MRSEILSPVAARLARWRSSREGRRAAFWGLLVLGLGLAVATFAVLGGMEGLGSRAALRAVLIADFLFALLVATLVARRVGEILVARRRDHAGSRLHSRLVRFFTGVSLVPTVLLAVFATITLNFGLEGWFSDRVRNVVSNSLEAAQAYENEHRVTLQTDAQVLGSFLNDQKSRYPLLSGGQLRELLTSGQRQMQRALPKAYIIDSDRELRARGERSYLFYYTPPAQQDIDAADAGDVVVIRDWENSEFRALLRLNAFPDHYLYVSRDVDGEILSLLDETQETVALYQQLENERGSILFEFALIYLGVAFAVVLAAVWAGLWFADRLARPVGRLARAAERVGQGDLNVRVVPGREDDELALLGRTFNEMTMQVKAQQDELIAAHDDTERRRRLFDSVLTGVTAGVIGMDGDGRIEVVNAAAAQMLELPEGEALRAPLREVVPEFAALLDKLDTRRDEVVQGEVRLQQRGGGRDLLVRTATRRSDAGDLEGYVVSFDDVTELVVAQRMAAWGDVARRIAHEVKNPLTPIQLSAERIRRKFGPMVGENREALEQYADVIVRQTNDLRQIVDEFSRFARMRSPERSSQDLVRLIREVTLLQETAHPEIAYRLDLPDHAVLAHLDATMINQALTNLLKNAAEAIEERFARDPDGPKGEIRVRLQSSPDSLEIGIQDNGRGLPDQPARLFEPYVTDRASGTGLGLPIVRKIVEEHGGKLDLVPAPSFGDGARPGAWARIVLPQALPQRGGEDGPGDGWQDAEQGRKESMR